MIMAGGKGSRLGPLTIHRSQARRPVRRPLPDHRLRPVELRQLRVPADLRAHAVHVVEPDQAPHAQLAALGLRRVHRGRPGADAPRRVLVPRHRRRRLPEPQPRPRRARRARRRVRRRPRLQVRRRPDGDQFHRDTQRRPHRRRVPGADARGAAPSASSTSTSSGRIIGFVEKPKNPPEMPGRPGWSLVSMGNYIFQARGARARARRRRRHDQSSRHDFGRDIIPRLVAEGARVFVYDFAPEPASRASPRTPSRTGATSARSTATSTSNMELRARVPALDLYNRQWRIRSAQRDYPPARFVRAGEGVRPPPRSTTA